MAVVPAGMHHVDLLAEIGALGLGGERQALWFFDRQRVHVGAQSHHRSGLVASEHGDHAGASNAGLHLKA